MTDTALLLRRAGFGPTAAELAAAKERGYEATVELLVAPSGPDRGADQAPYPDLPMDPYAAFRRPPSASEVAKADYIREDSIQRLTRWWLDRMTVADHQAREKLVFFWHGHWATSVKKVRDARFFLRQHNLLRFEDFVAMAHGMVTDPAMIHWLDGQLNTKAKPNENLGRELMELFMLGIGNYTEADVKAAGRALTGWKVDYARVSAYFEPRDFDPGPKTVLGVSQPFTAHSLVDFLAVQPVCPRFIATRMWYRYGSATQPIPSSTLDRMTAAFPHGPSMLRAMVTDGAFTATAGTMAKQPVEWFVGAMRQLGIRPATMPAQMQAELVPALEALGQAPLAPPSVGGWPSNNAWLTTGATQLRLGLAGMIAQIATPPLTVDALAETLTVQWTKRTAAALAGVADPRQRLILALVSPEYLVS